MSENTKSTLGHANEAQSTLGCKAHPRNGHEVSQLETDQHRFIDNPSVRSLWKFVNVTTDRKEQAVHS